MKIYCMSATSRECECGLARYVMWYTYYSFVQFSEGIYCVYAYESIETKRPDRILKPARIMKFTSRDDFEEAEEICKEDSFAYGDRRKGTVNSVSESEAAFLFIPKEVIGYEIVSKKVVIDPVIPEDIVEDLRDRGLALTPIVVIGEDRKQVKLFNSDNGLFTNRSFKRMYCSNCGKVFFVKTDDYNYSCPNCNMTSGNSYKCNEIADGNVIKEQENNFAEGKHRYYDVCNSYLSKHIFYVQAKPNGVIIYDILYKFSAKGGVVKEEFTAKTMLKHLIGEEMKAYKISKKGKSEIDPFDALKINSRNLQQNYRDMCYRGCESYFDFLKKNKDMLKMIGFSEVSKYGFNVGCSEAFFILFIGILNKYPVLEQLVKMGYANLFFSVYKSIAESENKAELTGKIAQLSQLVNVDATKGKEALRIPIYIGEYLRQGNADLNKYFLWRDIYETTNISKEGFLEIVESPEYFMIIPNLKEDRLINILKFGYPILKLFRYILKGTKAGYEISRRIEWLSDYLSMCDILQISIDMYPVDLRGVHDKTVTAFRERENDANNIVMAKIASEASEYVLPKDEQLKPGVPKLFEEYTVVFPSSTGSLLDEGNQQHNCVGSYTRRVVDGYSVVFFIRKKESPEKSFITAECCENGLSQIYYSNNRRVENKELIDFGDYICKKIIAGCKSKKISALHNRRIRIA